jgi:hypothetical protein
MAISDSPETTYNAIKIASGDLYRGMLTRGRNPLLPDVEKSDDTGTIGAGQEFATQQQSGFLTAPAIEITERLNVDIVALLARRAMGGAITMGTVIETGGTVPSTVARPHTFGLDMAAAARQLPSSSVAWSVGGADYIWGGVVVESFRIDQSGVADPTVTVGMVGSGVHKKISTIGTPPTFPLPTAQRYMLGPDTQVEYTDTALRSLTTARRLLNFSMTLTNNHTTDDRRPGDPAVDPTNPNAGWYTDRMYYGDRTIGAEMTIMIDDTMRELTNARDDVAITNFTFRARGKFLTNATGDFTSTANRATFEVTFPKCYFRNVRAGDDGGRAVATVSIVPVSVAGASPVTVKVISNADVATRYV